MSANSLDKIMSWLNTKRTNLQQAYQDSELGPAMQQMGKIRVETIEGLMETRKLEMSKEVPILYTNTILDRIDAAMPEEKEATDDYAELENQFREEAGAAEKAGIHDVAARLTEEADIVHEIRGDEVDHLAKFEAMHKRLTEVKK